MRSARRPGLCPAPASCCHCHQRQLSHPQPKSPQAAALGVHPACSAARENVRVDLRQSNCGSRRGTGRHSMRRAVEARHGLAGAVWASYSGSCTHMLLRSCQGRMTAQQRATSASSQDPDHDAGGQGVTWTKGALLADRLSNDTGTASGHMYRCKRSCRSTLLTPTCTRTRRAVAAGRSSTAAGPRAPTGSRYCHYCHCPHPAPCLLQRPAQPTATCPDLGRHPWPHHDPRPCHAGAL